MRVTVKICGLTCAADAEAAIAAGADFLGFVFFPASRRCLGPTDQTWVRSISGVPKVGVFRNQASAEVARLREEAGLDLVQLHGDEPVEDCLRLGGRERVIKAVPVANRVKWNTVHDWARAAQILFDTASPTGGGTGRTFDWSVLSSLPEGLDFWLAGGLCADNVGAAIERLHPSGVDVASGVEVAVGRKDAARMRAFVTAVRAACEKGREGRREGHGGAPHAGGTEGMR